MRAQRQREEELKAGVLVEDSKTGSTWTVQSDGTSTARGSSAKHRQKPSELDSISEGYILYNIVLVIFCY